MLVFFHWFTVSLNWNIKYSILNLSSCKEATNSRLTEITDKCKKLKLLDITGCTAITERNVSNATLLLQMYLCVISVGVEKVTCMH